MRQIVVTLIALSMASTTPVIAQTAADSAGIRQALFDYIDGFYSGDSTLLVRSVSPSVVKYGYWRAHADSGFVGEPMTYQQITRKPARPPRARPDAPREVTLLDADQQVASGKVKAWWGIDYILLAKENGRWMIHSVLWQGPLDTVR